LYAYCITLSYLPGDDTHEIDTLTVQSLVVTLSLSLSIYIYMYVYTHT
jgi:hypothetical protein